MEVTVKAVSFKATSEGNVNNYFVRGSDILKPLIFHF